MYARMIDQQIENKPRVLRQRRIERHRQSAIIGTPFGASVRAATRVLSPQQIIVSKHHHDRPSRRRPCLG